ncbi:MAG: hypothetical protein ACPKPY_05995 [Nitrososphaeraceae archaeon]
MSKNKIGIFSALMFGVMMLLIPATSIANAQEYDKKYYEDEPYKKDKSVIIIKNEPNLHQDKEKKKMKPAMVEITKELFVCDNILNVTEENENFFCGFSESFRFTPAPPDSPDYISCDSIEGGCPGVDESDFSAAVYKDIAVARDLSSTEQTPVDLTKINYIVSEDRADDVINNEGENCNAVGFDDSTNYATFLSEDIRADYNICILYEGDCEGEIYPGEVKECTVKNFIFEGRFTFPRIE